MQREQAEVNEEAEVKVYSDFKSPYAYLAFDPAFALEDKYHVTLKWKPFQLRLKGKGERSQYSEYKVKYSYMDARRWANMRGGLMIRGPLKIFDTTPALIGGLYAEKHGKLRAYGNKVFDLFFKRELAADEADAIAPVVESVGLSVQGYRDYLTGEGPAEGQEPVAPAPAHPGRRSPDQVRRHHPHLLEAEGRTNRAVRLQVDPQGGLREEGGPGGSDEVQPDPDDPVRPGRGIPGGSWGPGRDCRPRPGRVPGRRSGSGPGQ